MVLQVFTWQYIWIYRRKDAKYEHVCTKKEIAMAVYNIN